MMKRIATLALLLLTCIALPTSSFAGGHTGPKKPKKEIKLDPALRSEITGTVLITGSNRGIGLELARNYAARGWTVIATARKPNKADALQELANDNPNVTIEQLDVLDHARIDALAEKYKDTPIDVLLNNAAILGEPRDQLFGSRDYALMDQVFEVNVKGPMKMAEAFADNVAKSEQKKIVGVTSTQGSISSAFSGTQGSLVFYNISKAALNMGMKSNSQVLKARGITVVIVSPGAVDTDMMNLALRDSNATMKLLTTQQSAEAVINVIDQYGFDMSGSFVSHTGTEIPW